MPVTPLRPSDPAQVGPHRLLARLGQGGMGTVYLGVSPDERAVAVKVLRDSFADPDARGRFRHELEALRRVRGPHLVEVLDADVEADTPYLVTRFVPGTRLDDLVTRGGPLAPGDLHQVARGLADALAALHAAGVVHRDLTPGNVLVLDGQPHVIDLGLATAADVTAFTRSGLVIGTPGYLAPEQVTGSVVDTAVDVHAWGATVALAGTGRPPYGTGRPEAVLYRIVHGQPDLDGLPEPIAGLVAAAMDRDPQRRPDARALLAALGGASDAPAVSVHLPRDVDATTVLRPSALQAEVTDLLPRDTRTVTGPVRELATASSGPRATLAAAPVPLAASPHVADDEAVTGPQPRWTEEPYAAPAGRDGSTRVQPQPPAATSRAVQSRGGADGDGPWTTGPDPRHEGPDDRHGDGDRVVERYDDADRQHAWRGEDDDGPEYHDRAYDDRTYDDRAYDDRGDDGDDAGGQELPSRTHPARELQAVLTGTAAIAVVGAVTLVAPVVGAALALLALVLLRATGRSQDRLRDRREKRGDRRRDPLVATLGAPWHVALAAVDTALSLPLLALVAAVPAAIVWLSSPNLPGLERPELTAAVAVVTALLAGLGRGVHRRSRRMLRRTLITATPGTAGAVVVVVVLSAIALLLLATAEGSAPTWWPLSGVGTRTR